MTQRETFEEWWETKGRFAGPESGVSWFDARTEMMGHAYAAALASDTRRSFSGVMQTAFLGCAPVIDGEPFHTVATYSSSALTTSKSLRAA